MQRRALDVLTQWATVDPERLGFFGHSGGAFQGAILSGIDSRPRAVALAAFGYGSQSGAE